MFLKIFPRLRKNLNIVLNFNVINISKTSICRNVMTHEYDKVLLPKILKQESYVNVTFSNIRISETKREAC